MPCCTGPQGSICTATQPVRSKMQAPTGRCSAHLRWVGTCCAAARSTAATHASEISVNPARGETASATRLFANLPHTPSRGQALLAGASAGSRLCEPEGQQEEKWVAGQLSCKGRFRRAAWT